MSVGRSTRFKKYFGPSWNGGALAKGLTLAPLLRLQASVSFPASCFVAKIISTNNCFVISGLLGKWVPVAQRTGVDRVFGAMKALISSPDGNPVLKFLELFFIALINFPYSVAPPIAEAAIETAILLGSETKAQSVLDILKEWRPKKDVSSHLQNILKVFLKKSLKSKRSLVNDASDENNSASE